MKANQNGTRSLARNPHEGGWCATCFVFGVAVATLLTGAGIVVAAL